MRTNSKTIIFGALCFVAGIWFASVARCNDLEAAVIDRQQLPQKEWGYYYYFTTDSVPADQRVEFGQILRFMVASSSTQPIIERCTPVQVGPTLFRIDARDVKWDARQVASVLAESPYRRIRHDGATLVTPASWLITQLADTTEGNAYYQLLYGKAELSRNDFLAAHKANLNSAQQISYAEDQSGVSVAGDRWLMNFDTANRVDVWGTIDFFKLNSKTDPTNNLLYTADTWRDKPVHDGEEWIAGLPKVSIKSMRRGRLQAYLLSAGNGNRVEEAPPRLVTDKTGFRNHTAIVNVGSCISCHTKGLKEVSVDAVRSYLASGAQIKTYDKAKQEQIELLVLQHVAPLIDQANQEYAIGCDITCGLKPEGVSQALVNCVSWYDQHVTLEQAGVELYSSGEQLKLALAWRDVTYSDLNSLQAKLAAGVPIPRTAWEDIYTATALLVKQWQESIK